MNELEDIEMDNTDEILSHLAELKAKNAVTKRAATSFNKMVKNGVVVHKGSVLIKRRINKNLPLYEIYGTYFSAYPDLFLDLIKPESSHFELFFYQRLFLRACLRYKYVYTTAPRALTGGAL